LSNLLISLAVARGSGLGALGRFAVATAVYYVVIGLQRALVADPLLVSGRPDSAGGSEDRASLGCCLAIGLAGGVLTLTAGVAIGHAELIALAVCLPLLAVQDGLRFVSFHRLEPRTAAVIDLVWVGAAAAAWPVLGAASPAGAVLLWGAGATVSAAAGFVLLHVWPAGPRTAIRWWKTDAGRLAVTLGAEAVLASSATQASMLIVAGVLGSAALGALRAAQIVVAPALLLLTGFAAFALPRLARRRHDLRRTDAVWASAAAVVLICPVIGLASLKSDAVVRTLFGPGTVLHRSILAGLLVGTVVAAATQGVVLLLKVTRRGTVLLGARVVAASTLVGLVLLLAASGKTAWLGWAFAGQSTAYLATTLGILFASRRPVERTPDPAIT
jgi:O-antigen/teichoic acid export membrane protein